MRVSCRRFIWKPLFIFLVLATLAGSAFSQIPSPASVAAEESIRQQERERTLREQQEREPSLHLDKSLPEEAILLPQKESPCFPISAIDLAGTSADRFRWAVKAANPPGDPALGRCLGSQGINVVMKRIQNAIVAQGFVTTRILAGPQDLTTGKLTLTVIPGKIRQIRRADGTSSRATLGNAVPANTGELLNLRDVEQGLENLKRVPTADADIQIVPAEGKDAQPGESDLAVKWQQNMPLRLAMSLDDSGTKGTGKNQGSFTISLDNPIALNDLFYLTYNQDLGGSHPGNRGTHGYVAHYSLPFGYWLLGFTSSESNYFQTVAGNSQSYLYSGDSSNADIKLSRVIYRDAVGKASAYIKAWQRTSHNFIDHTEVVVQRRRMGGWEAGFADQLAIAQSNLEFNLIYRKGTGAFGSLHAPEEAFNEGTARPELFTADAQFTLPFKALNQSFRYRAAWRGQWSRTPLIPQDRFSIGGRYTVRGFDGENTLMGERGQVLRNDLGILFGDLWPEFYLALDHGYVEGPSTRVLVGKRLTGAALGWRGSFKQVSYDFFVGQPVSKPDRFVTPATTTGFSLNLAL